MPTTIVSPTETVLREVLAFVAICRAEIHAYRAIAKSMRTAARRDIAHRPADLTPILRIEIRKNRGKDSIATDTATSASTTRIARHHRGGGAITARTIRR